MSVIEYSKCLRSIWQELNVYRPLTVNLEELKQQREEFEVVKFLHGLDPKYEFIRTETIFSKKMPPQYDMFYRVHRAESMTLALSSNERDTSSLATLSAQSASNKYGCQDECSKGNYSLKITQMMLNEDNYFLWEQDVYMYLEAFRKLKYINADPPEPQPEEWESENYLVMARLLNSMEPDICTQVMYHDTAKQIWEALKEIYIRKENCFRVYELYEKLFSLEQGDMSVLEYSSCFHQIRHELKVYCPLTTNLEELKQQREEFLVAKFLHGLGPEYEFIRSEIITSAKMPPLIDVLPRILRADKFLTSSKQSASDKKRYQKKQRREQKDDRSIHKAARQCIHCGRHNHNSDACWEKFGKPA